MVLCQTSVKQGQC